MSEVALSGGMLLRVMPTEPPIEVVSVTPFEVEGVRWWLIDTKPQRIRGGYEHTSYRVPDSLVPSLRVVA